MQAAVKTILVAEDEPALAEIIEYLLSEAGYRVLLARDGDEAVAYLDDQQPDLFLLDVMMPGRDGFEVAREIRMHPRFEEAHILFLSARSDEASRRKGYADGAEQYITKPFDNDDLLDRIEELLR